VSGTAGGAPLAVTDEVAFVGTGMENGVTQAYAGVFITNVAGTCGILQRGANPPSLQMLQIAVGAPGSTVTAGSYALGSSTTSTASALFQAEDATCTPTTNEQASSGTITLSSVDGSTVKGSFDLTFANGDHLTGSFSAPVCDASLAGSSDNPTCGN
jgi:hypothetical protein